MTSLVKARSIEEIIIEADRIVAEVEARKSSYAAAVEVAELASLVRNLADQMVDLHRVYIKHIDQLRADVAAGKVLVMR